MSKVMFNIRVEVSVGMMWCRVHLSEHFTKHDQDITNLTIKTKVKCL